MPTLETLRASRAAAGAAYAAAAKALIDAHVELKAHDMALENGNIGGGVQRSFGPFDVSTLGHGEFLRDVRAVSGDVFDRIRDRHIELLKG